MTYLVSEGYHFHVYRCENLTFHSGYVNLMKKLMNENNAIEVKYT
jgi:hypothetical protein